MRNRAYAAQVQSGETELVRQTFTDMLLRDPAEPTRWADLGSAYADIADVGGGDGALTKARYCFNRALELGKTTSSIQIYAGAFYFDQGERRRAYQSFSEVLAVSRDYDGAVFARYEDKRVPVAEVLAYGIPAERKAGQAYLRSLLRPEKVAEAAVVWQWLAARGFASGPVANEYPEFLIRQAKYGDAVEAWASQLADRGDYAKTEMVYNGGFELDPAAGPFAWMLAPADHVDATFDGEPHSGARSFRARFNGQANIDYSNLSQRAVLSGGRYRLRAYIRTEGLTTNEGVFLEVRELGPPDRVLLETERFLGTRGWTESGGTFEAPDGTHLVEIRLKRRASMKFDNKIQGTVWLDDVSLRRDPQPNVK